MDRTTMFPQQRGISQGRTGISPYLVSCLFTCLFTFTAPALGGESVQLGDYRQAGDMQRVQTTIQVQGKLRATDNDKSPSAEMSANGQMSYDEILLQCPAANLANRTIIAGRHYDAAEATMQVGIQKEDIKIGDKQSTIIVRSTDKTNFSSATTPLSRKEVDMLTVPGSSLDVYRLLPNKQLEVGSTWAIDSKDLAKVFNLDEVTVNETRARLVAVTNGLAKMQITGRIVGNVHGAATQLELNADFRFDTRWQRVNWLQLVIKENRETNAVQPGFDVTAEIRMLISPTKDAAALNVNELRRMASIPAPANLRFESDLGDLRLLHGENWHVIEDNSDKVTMRLVEGGKTIAQCNLRKVNESTKKDMTLDTFKSEIQTALAGRMQQFTDVQEINRKDGYRIFHIGVDGRVADVPINWIYYHVTSPSGDQAAYVYTLETENLELFASRDKTMVNSIVLGDAASSANIATSPSNATTR